MALFLRWCEANRVTKTKRRRRNHYWLYVEKAGGRANVLDELVETVRSHYGRLELIADDVRRLGFEGASEILRQTLPQTPRGRSGDFGEILGTEFVEEEIGIRVPVRRLRYKDGREMAMRGDDFIGVDYDPSREVLRLLKGEAKSYEVLGRKPVEEAREVLNRDSGHCTPGSLLFVANCLLESSDAADKALGRRLRDEVGVKYSRVEQVNHVLFTVSGNGPHDSLKKDHESVGTNRDHYVVNVHIEDHQEFIAAVFVEAERLGDG